MATQPAAPSQRRIGHKKSRLGCARCKARHVKCDEQAPCRNCVRHGLECSLVASASGETANDHHSPRGLFAPASRAGPGRASPSSSSTTHHVSPLGHHPPLPPSQPHSSYAQRPSLGALRSSTLAGGNGYPDVLCSEPPSIYTPHWMQSVRLFHHFCQYTAYNMSGFQATTDLWRKRVPDVACSHEFLMHGLLAVSALHFARTNPTKSQEYVLISTHYQTLALQYFTNRVSDINEENVEAYFLLATFIFMLATASISDPDPVRNRATGPHDLAQSFLLLQGVKGILSAKAAEKFSQHDGPLAAMLHQRDDLPRPMPSRVSNFTRRLDRLIGLTRELDSSLLFDVVNNPQTACILALESLRQTYFSCVEVVSKYSSPAATSGLGTSPHYTGATSAATPSHHGSPAVSTPTSMANHNITHAHNPGTPHSAYDQHPIAATAAENDSKEYGQRYTWLWPLTLTQTFIQLVESGNYMALIIVAHYAAMAKPYEGQFWVSNGWCRSLLRIVEQHLHQDKHQWIAWPKRSILEEIGVDDMPDEM